MTPVPLHAVRSGRQDGPTVVFGGSLGSDISMWQELLPRMDDAFDVVRYDLRGHGRSPVPDPPYDIADLGDDLLALLDQWTQRRTHLVGTSLGAMVAMWVAAQAPERVGRLVLCCTSAHLGPASMWAERAAHALKSGTGSLAAAVLERWFTSGFAEREPAMFERAREMLVSTPDVGYAGCCGAIERMDLRPVLANISAPTLVIAGAADPATRIEHAQVLAERIPYARLEVVPDAAHLAPVERSGTVAQLILSHLEDG